MDISIKDTKDGFYSFFGDGEHLLYYVPKSTCRTATQLSDWLVHLKKKQWWTENLEVKFLKLIHGK